MERVFTELTPECEITARMYAQGYEKKEIANFKCRAVSTINNQLQKAFEILHVRNGRELATMLYERIAGVRLTMDFSPIVRVSVACCLLCIFSLTIQSTDLKEFAEHLVKKTVRSIRDSFIRPEEDYLTIKEASQILHTDKSTLWRWHKIGYLCRLEIGGKRLYRKSDVDAILQKENN